MGMINIDNFVKSKQIQFIYKIINSEMDSWNAIGKHWLQKYDNKFGFDCFLCKCSDIKGLDIASIPKYNVLSRRDTSIEKFFGVIFYGV